MKSSLRIKKPAIKKGVAIIPLFKEYTFVVRIKYIEIDIAIDTTAHIVSFLITDDIALQNTRITKSAIRNHKGPNGKKDVEVT